MARLGRAHLYFLYYLGADRWKFVVFKIHIGLEQQVSVTPGVQQAGT